MALVQATETKNQILWTVVLNSIFAWSKVSRWRKASKWKSQIKQVQQHLAIQKNRKESIIKQSRADIAQLLQNGHVRQALHRVEQLYKDQRLMLAYDQINHFCVCIITNLSRVTMKSSSAQNLPADVGEAVATLIYAASRCGELPELHMLRNQFKECYGYEFENTNVELLPGNLVNFEIKQNLCIGSIPDDVKLNLISEIFKDFSHHLVFRSQKQTANPEVYKYEQKAEVLDLNIRDLCGDSDESYIHTPFKKAATPIQNKGASSAKISSNGTPQIYKKSTTFLCDIKKDLFKQRGDCGKNMLSVSRSAVTGTDLTKNSAINDSSSKPEIPRSRHCRTSTGIPLSKNHYNTVHNKRFSLDGSVDDWKEQQGYSCSSHVHPKLPDYEDFVAKFEDLKMENGRHKRFQH